MRFLVVYDITYKREYDHNARKAKMPKINYKSIVNNWTSVSEVRSIKNTKWISLIHTHD